MCFQRSLEGSRHTGIDYFEFVVFILDSGPSLENTVRLGSFPTRYQRELLTHKYYESYPLRNIQRYILNSLKYNMTWLHRIKYQRHGCTRCVLTRFQDNFVRYAESLHFLVVNQLIRLLMRDPVPPPPTNLKLRKWDRIIRARITSAVE